MIDDMFDGVDEHTSVIRRDLPDGTTVHVRRDSVGQSTEIETTVLKIWWLRRSDEFIYERWSEWPRQDTDEAVVVAENEDEARKAAAQSGGDVWHDCDMSRCEELTPFTFCVRATVCEDYGYAEHLRTQRLRRTLYVTLVASFVLIAVLIGSLVALAVNA